MSISEEYGAFELTTLLVFYLNLYGTFIGPTGFLSGRSLSHIDLSRMLAGSKASRAINGIIAYAIQVLVFSYNLNCI